MQSWRVQQWQAYLGQAMRPDPRTALHHPCSVMLVGWGGNNGTTVTGGILANKQ
jgi:hypothetical protein